MRLCQFDFDLGWHVYNVGGSGEKCHTNLDDYSIHIARPKSRVVSLAKRQPPDVCALLKKCAPRRNAMKYNPLALRQVFRP